MLLHRHRLANVVSSRLLIVSLLFGCLAYIQHFDAVALSSRPSLALVSPYSLVALLSRFSLSPCQRLPFIAFVVSFSHCLVVFLFRSYDSVHTIVHFPVLVEAHNQAHNLIITPSFSPTLPLHLAVQSDC